MGNGRPHPPPPGAYLRARVVETIFIGGGRGGGTLQGQAGRGRGGEGVAGGSSLENLHAMVVSVSHHDAPVAADGNAAERVAELSVA